jgi:hypothetical protein
VSEGGKPAICCFWKDALAASSINNVEILMGEEREADPEITGINANECLER